ncbi:MAG TPA: hypothetical protein VK116_09935 [Planctomycetota bacterium]|nr:hypothetical protein [Planctomycetota bacterium]
MEVVHSIPEVVHVETGGFERAAEFRVHFLVEPGTRLMGSDGRFDRSAELLRVESMTLESLYRFRVDLRRDLLPETLGDDALGMRTDLERARPTAET